MSVKSLLIQGLSIVTKDKKTAIMFICRGSMGLSEVFFVDSTHSRLQFGMEVDKTLFSLRGSDSRNILSIAADAEGWGISMNYASGVAGFAASVQETLAKIEMSFRDLENNLLHRFGDS